AHAAVVLLRVEGRTGQVSFHDGSPSRDVEDACFQAESQVLVENGSQVGDALGLLQRRERAHLGAVLGARGDLTGARPRELAGSPYAVDVKLGTSRATIAARSSGSVSSRSARSGWHR